MARWPSLVSSPAATSTASGAGLFVTRRWDMVQHTPAWAVPCPASFLQQRPEAGQRKSQQKRPTSYTRLCKIEKIHGNYSQDIDLFSMFSMAPCCRETTASKPLESDTYVCCFHFYVTVRGVRLLQSQCVPHELLDEGDARGGMLI